MSLPTAVTPILDLADRFLPAPLVRHPETGKPGVLISRELLQLWQAQRLTGQQPMTRAVFRGEHLMDVSPPYHYVFTPGECPLSRIVKGYLQANEFDPTRDFEILRLPESGGDGVFYL
jgi:hypothetical protein